VENLQPIDAAPPNLRETMCGKHRRRPAAEEADEEDSAGGSAREEAGSIALLSARAAGPKPSSLVAETTILGPPVEVYIGPPRRPRDPAVAARPDDAVVVDGRGKPAGRLLALPDRSSGAQGVPPLRVKPAAVKPKNSLLAAKPVKLRRPAKSAKPVKPEGPATAAKPAGVATVAKPTASGNAAAKPAGSGNAAGSTNPAKPARPAGSAAAAKLTKPPPQ
jgi:D-alanyl-D-alanine carboxypeptidase